MNDSGIDSVLVTYFCGIIDSNVAFLCEKIAEIQRSHPKNDYSSPLPMELVDTFLTNSSVFNRIETLLEKNYPVDDFNIDSRMFVTLKNKDGSEDHICIGDRTPLVKYNGKSYSMDNELIFLLRYHSGYYLWIDESYLSSFPELRDTLFYNKALEQIR